MRVIGVIGLWVAFSVLAGVCVGMFIRAGRGRTYD